MKQFPGVTDVGTVYSSALALRGFDHMGPVIGWDDKLEAPSGGKNTSICAYRSTRTRLY